MKLLDKTPWLDEKGELTLLGRIQGSFKYGMNWYAEMEAQKEIIAILDRSLEKGFVLIRNLTLPNNIIIPLALLGLNGVQVIYVTPVKGQFEAKGDQWNKIDSSGNSQPASENLLDRVSKLARVFHKFLETQNVKLPSPVEPVLISVNPGAHIESMRPIVKVVKSDAIKPYVASLLQAPPVWRPEYLYALADRLVDPRLGEPPVTEESKQKPEENEPLASETSYDYQGSRESFSADDYTSLTADDHEPVHHEESAAPAKQPRPRKKAAPAQKKIFGMTRTQVYILVGFLAFWLCAMAVIVALMLFSAPQ